MSSLRLIVDKVPIIDGSEHWTLRTYIAVGSHTRDDDDGILLSPDCATTTELNWWADMLIKELQDIKRKANRLQWNNRRPRGQVDGS
jgi:hypothetical protein